MSIKHRLEAYYPISYLTINRLWLYYIRKWNENKSENYSDFSWILFKK